MSIPLEISPKHALWTEQLLLPTKVVVHAIYSWRTERKRSSYVPNQDCNKDGQLMNVWKAQIVDNLTTNERALSWWRNDPTALVTFPYFTRDFHQTNCCVPFRIQTVPRSSKGTVTIWPVFPKETDNHLFRSASCKTNLWWVSGSDTDPRPITCYNLIHVWSTAIVFFLSVYLDQLILTSFQFFLKLYGM